MKQFGKIFSFELKYALKNKAFVGTTLFLVALIAIVMFYPRISDSLKGEEAVSSSAVSAWDAEDEDASSWEDRSIMLLKTDESLPEESVLESFSAAFDGYEVRISDEEIDAIKEQIVSGEVDCAFVMTEENAFTYYVNNLSMYDVKAETAEAILQQIYQMNALVSSGMSEEEAIDVMNIQIDVAVENLGKDQMMNFFYTYIMIFALYMVILLYGQMIASNVASEKSSRAMELLVTSANPTAMMFGKILASCLTGLIQLTAIFGSSVLFYRLNQSYWSGNMMVASIFDIPPELIGYMLIFFLLGFLLYAFMFGAAGSTVSKLEDLNTAVMPITMFFIIAFIVSMYSMSAGNVDGLLMKICAFIPFTSPMAMFTRIAMSTVPLYEVAASIAILLASAAVVGVISAKIYRVGVLMYGNKPSIAGILKAVKRA